MSDNLPKPVAWTDDYEMSIHNETGTMWHEKFKGADDIPLFTAEQVAELMERIESYWSGDGVASDVVLIEKFRAAYCNQPKD